MKNATFVMLLATPAGDYSLGQIILLKNEALCFCLANET